MPPPPPVSVAYHTYAEQFCFGRYGKTRVHGRVVVGVGVNLCSAPDLPDRLATSLCAYGVTVDRDTFAERLHEVFTLELERWRGAGLAPVLRRWQTVLRVQLARQETVSSRTPTGCAVVTALCGCRSSKFRHLEDHVALPGTRAWKIIGDNVDRNMRVS